MFARLAIVAVFSVFALFQPASAEVLWDQADFDAFGPGFFNSESGSPPFGLTVHAVNAVTVPDGGWNVESVTTYYSALSPDWGAVITEGYLHVFDKTGPLPDDVLNDPTASPLVSMSAVLDVDHFVLTASGLDIDLAPGEYWIGITPIAPAGPFGPEIHLSSLTLIGDATASYDVFAFPGPPAWFNFNPGTDASILIQGTTGGPVPTHNESWGSVKSLFRN